ncbi:ion transporter [Candidatus Woesearchaeota archaeon]|jgi:voltage-gated potassium channel|nr:ion transporter [Candidatus Woesearchaeota archaeon]MBT5342722.1 ion transporter [Candidatus Woesearchaeota archaeon]
MAKKKTLRKNSKLTNEDAIDLKIMQKGEKLEEKGLNKIKGYLHLHLDNYASTHGRLIEGSLFFINFLAIVLFIVETHGPTGIYRTILSISEITLISIFIVEYAARMWVAEKKVKHFFNIYTIIDLIVILPILSYLPMFSSATNLGFFRILRILRLFRMLRVLRFQRMFKSQDTMFGRITDSQLVIIRIVMTVFTIVLIASGLIWTVESKVNPDQVGTIWDAMYFSIVTLTTVGYGDVTPLSPAGKIVTILMILSGIALIPWQLGKLIKILFMEATKTKIICQKCKLEEHEKDSIHCRRCGVKLKKVKEKEVKDLEG